MRWTQIAQPQTLLALSDAGRAVFWVAALIVLALVGGAVLMVLRRALLHRGDDPAHTPVLTLADLRAMRDKGEINDAEYARAREVLLREAGASATPKAPRRDVVGGAPGLDLTGDPLPPPADRGKKKGTSEEPPGDRRKG
ncbi:MAG: hypothetical protein EA379_11095 [Phycisphaerales bacterium]|nr:MAG: hypothetical protein EA379_11095 [Phycisphaerales bacterium]